MRGGITLYLSLLPSCCDKHHEQKQLGEARSLSGLQVAVIIGERQGRSSSRSQQGRPLAGLLSWLAHFAFL